jgi:hypothetical protein
LITSSKHLTFNILREYWVACCVFFYRSYDFQTYFLKNPVHSVFSGRFSVFCRNRLTLVQTKSFAYANHTHKRFMNKKSFDWQLRGRNVV